MATPSRVISMTKLIGTNSDDGKRRQPRGLWRRTCLLVVQIGQRDRSH
jgi:hypothetical protein